jgi:hypothetical protein
MSEPTKFSDVILNMGKDFQADAMEDYHDRVKSGEFAGKTEEEIRDIYYQEAIDSEEDEELNKHFQEIKDMEEEEDEE